MKRFILILAIVLVFAAMPLFAKGSRQFASVGYDITFPLYGDFGSNLRGDLAGSYAKIGAADGGGLGFYSYNTLRMPINEWSKGYGFSSIDLSKYLDFYLTSIIGFDLAVPVSGKFEIVLGLGLNLEGDLMCTPKADNFLDSASLEMGPGARLDVIFNITDSIFLDFGVEAAYNLYMAYAFPDFKEYGFVKVNDFNYPSCGLKAGISF